ncbi:MAG: hypothetical protein R3Y68_05145 [Rikenellaceae bacterium]
MAKKLLFMFAAVLTAVLFSCSSDVAVDDPEDLVVDESTDLGSIETIYGKVSSVDFFDDYIALTFVSGVTMDFDYPDAIFPYIGANGNWWLNDKDTGFTSTGADGADGADGSNGSNGSNGADGSDGSDGTDGADGADGANGADGADGADGVGIDSITYSDGKLTIKLTDGTTNTFTLGVSDSGSLTGTNDYLSDESPMLLSAISCGDIDIVNFTYDAQSRMTGASYNTIEYNAPKVAATMSREYDVDGLKSITTFSQLAQYDGETKDLGQDWSTSSWTDLESLATYYTTEELMDYLLPNGLWVNYNGNSYEYDDLGSISGISSANLSTLKSNILSVVNEKLDQLRWWNTQVVYDSNNGMLYYIMIFSEVSYNATNNSTYKAMVVEVVCSDWWMFEYGSGSLLNVISVGDERYASTVQTSYSSVPTYNSLNMYVESDYSLSNSNYYFDECYSTTNMTIPNINYYNWYEKILSEGESPVELVESGDGYKKYRVNQSLESRYDYYSFNEYSPYYLVDGVLKYKSEVSFYSSICDEYMIYEEGAMMEEARVYCAADDNDYAIYAESESNGGGLQESVENCAICVVMDEANDRVSKIQYWSVANKNGTESDDKLTEVEYIYNAAGSLESVDVITEDGTKYSGLISVNYDDKANPTEIVAWGAELKALEDDDVDELMAYLGVATKRSMLNTTTGLFETQYSYDESGSTAIAKFTYNYGYKNFLGNTLESINILPMGLTMNNALEEIKWAGHASYLFTDYSGFISEGYPEEAKLTMNISPLDIDGVSSPVLSGVSVGVEFSYTAATK